MSFREDLLKEPWRFDFYLTMRRAERHNAKKPRIGASETLEDDYVRLGQDPYLEFPASSFNRASVDRDGRLKLLVRFLGMMGPQGALPLATTEESWIWNRDGDDSFSRYLDIFEHRFLQLFYRAWADSRPIAHADRPKADRFTDYVGSAIGIGTPSLRDLDRVPDAAKLTYAGLMAPQAKSAARLRALLQGLFRMRVEVDQFVGSRLVFDEADRSKLGARHCRLGADLVIGASVFSVEDKITIRLFAADLDQYRDFLPSGDLCAVMTDAIYFYVGPEIDWDVEIAIPAARVRPAKLGQFGQLGWTSWLAPKIDPADAAIRCDARFHPMSRRQAAKPKPTPPKKRAKSH